MNSRSFSISSFKKEQEGIVTQKTVNIICDNDPDARKVREFYENILMEIRAVAECEPYEGIIERIKRIKEGS